MENKNSETFGANAPQPEPGSGLNRLVVDWDGTCVESAWPAMGDWLPGTIVTLKDFLAQGWEVVIVSTRLAHCDVDEATPRTEEQARETLRVREMLDSAGLQEVKIWNRPWKPGAVHYIDDKAIEFRPGRNTYEEWESISFRIGSPPVFGHKLESVTTDMREKEYIPQPTTMTGREAMRRALQGQPPAPGARIEVENLDEAREVTAVLTTITNDSAKRKALPVTTGVLDYFPAALAAVAAVSKHGNDKHNPGEPLHHARGKSMDHADSIARHLIDRGHIDPDTKMRHSAELAWRALALLQQELEDAGEAPLARGAKL